jgi:hypothetical protein
MSIPKKALTFAVLAIFTAAGTNFATAQAPAKTAPKYSGKAKASTPSTPDAAKKEHQLTGTITALSDTSLTLTHRKNKEGKTETTFAMSADTKKDGDVKKGAKVTVFYHDVGGKLEANRVKAALVPTSAARPPAKKPAKP